MNTLLQNIAQIQTGVFAKTVAKGDVVYLQPKYYDDDGMLTTKVVPDLNSMGISDNHILRSGDILFAAKGNRNFATCFMDRELKAAASTSFFVIRIHDTNVLPEFLTWYVNHPRTMTHLKAFARGSSIPSISKDVLNDLEIRIPRMDKQKLISKIDELRSKEKRMLMGLLSLRQTLNEQQLYNALN